MSYCLDSWAVLAWLGDREPAASRLHAALERERPSMSWINVVEVEYQIARRRGSERAASVIDSLRERVAVDLPRVATMRSVAKLKAAHPIALADCFAIATAAENAAALWTGDPEIIDRTDDLPCPVVDLRGA